MKRVVRLYYLFQFFFGLLLWVPIFYEYQRKFGLSDVQIFTIQSIYYLAFCILEIPTGLIADRFGYLSCLRWGAVFLFLANLFPIALPTYHGFLWHFLLVALSRSLVSGASSAYLYDWLKSHSQTEVYKGAEGKARAYGLIGKIIGWASVGVMMKLHLSLPYWLTGASALVALGFAWMLPTLGTQTARKSLDFAGAAKMLSGSPLIFLVMLQGISIFVLVRICQVNLFQPILVEKHFDVALFGVVMSVTSIFEAAGSLKPGWIRRYLSDLNAVFVMTLAMALSLSFIAVSGTWGTWLGLSVFAWLTGVSFPVQRQLLNDVIPDSQFRATLLSLESLMDRAACAWVASLLASYVSHGQVNFFLHISAAWSVVGVLVLWMALSAAPKVSRSRSKNFI